MVFDFHPGDLYSSTLILKHSSCFCEESSWYVLVEIESMGNFG